MIKLVPLLPINKLSSSKNAFGKKVNEVEESVADDDMKAAKAMKNDLEDAYDHVYNLMIKIDNKLSSFNEPGLKHAFIAGLRDGVKRQGKFDYKAARNKLKRYYSR